MGGGRLEPVGARHWILEADAQSSDLLSHALPGVVARSCTCAPTGHGVHRHLFLRVVSVSKAVLGDAIIDLYSVCIGIW